MTSTFAKRRVSQDDIATFARLTGDDSRIHLDPEYARANGLPGTIAHGLLAASWALGALTEYAPEHLGIGDSGVHLSGLSARFEGMIAPGDTLSFRHCDDDDWDADGHSTKRPDDVPFMSTAIEILNQRNEVVSGAEVLLGKTQESSQVLPSPARWYVERPATARSPTVYYAEDILELGPRGETSLPVVGEEDVVRFTEHSGESNPLYLDTHFARRAGFASRIVPPMLTFCLGFSEFLRELMVLPMPAAGFAGHLADTWNFYRPVSHNDSLRVVHQPLSCSRTKSRPEMAIVLFGLQLIDVDDVVVQDGVVTMMIPGRP